jgi:hypothetical protein
MIGAVDLGHESLMIGKGDDCPRPAFYYGEINEHELHCSDQEFGWII